MNKRFFESRLWQLIATAALAVAALQPAHAQPVLNGQMQIVVPVGPGGLNDLLARMVADPLGAQFKQSVIVVNKAGANGNIAAGFVARAKPDGTTLFMASAQLSGSVNLYKDLPFNLDKDFAPVALLAKTPYFLVVRTDLPVKSVSELIELAQKKPGVLNFSSTGIGSGAHLVAESFQQLTGVKLTHVPFGSAGQATTELLAGRVDLVFAGLPIVQPHVKSGKLRIIAVTLPERASFAPEVPTMKESGGPTMDFSAWFGILAPAGTPPDLVERVAKLSTDYVNEKEVATKLLDLGAIPQRGTPASFRDFIRSDVRSVAGVVRKAGISLE